MKAGDYLYCKQNYPIINDNWKINSNHRRYWFIKNHKYKIKEYNLNPKMLDEDGDAVLFEKHQIWDYFYKPQELRKLKLEQINESR